MSSIASAARLRTQPSWSWLKDLCSSCGPPRVGDRMPRHQRVAADQHAVDDERAVPAGVAGAGDGHRSAGQARGDVVGQRLRGRDAVAGQRPLAADRHRPLQPARLPDLRGDVDGRHLLEVLALGVTDLVGVAIHRRAMGFREPDRRAEVVDVGVGQQDRADVVDAEPELAQRRQHVVAVAGKPGVDHQQAGVVGDQCPVDQVGLREVHGVGDGRHGLPCAECMQRLEAQATRAGR